MDNQAAFNNCVTNTLQVNVPRNRLAITTFVSTFNQLLSTTEDELDSFVTSIHSSNSGRANNARLVILPNAVIRLKAILFELKDREICGTLPDLATLNAIDDVQLNILKRSRIEAKANLKNNKDNALTDTMKIPKFKSENYDEFMTAFSTLVSRKYGAFNVPLDYLLREQTVAADYNLPYDNRYEKLKNCIILHGDKFRSDRDALYSLYAEHIGTPGHGSNTINKYKTSKNGFLCHQSFVAHYANRAYKNTRATKANKAIRNAAYHGPRRNFNIETYYFIMTGAFNDLDNAGTAHALNTEQKIMKFKSGLRDTNAIKFALQAKSTYDTLPHADRTFDAFYNEFSSLMTEYSTLAGFPNTNANNSRRNATISPFASNYNYKPRNQGRGGRGRNIRGRGRGRSLAHEVVVVDVLATTRIDIIHTILNNMDLHQHMVTSLLKPKYTNLKFLMHYHINKNSPLHI